MKKLLAASAVLAVSLLSTSVATAQSVKKGTLSGTIVTASASPALNSSAPILTTPSSGFFVLTQACFSDSGAMHLQGSSVGAIAHDGFEGDLQCTGFQPGLAFPPGETITCVNDQNQTETCTVTGVLSKK